MPTTARVTAALLLLATSVAGHAAMTNPVPKQPDAMYWFQVGCYSGCECAGYGKSDYPLAKDHNCPNPKAPTNNDPDHRTFNAHNKSPAGDWTKHFPWRAPGFAIPLDSCGVASGFKSGMNAYGSPVTKGFQRGDKFTVAHGPTAVAASLNSTSNQWVAGKTAKVGFTIMVNHGGGYQYRLCPKGAMQTETCFEANTLDFATATSEIVFSKAGARKPVTVAATDVTAGVKPAGKAWRKIPIPACGCDSGGGCQDGGGAAEQYMKGGVAYSKEAKKFGIYYTSVNATKLDAAGEAAFAKFHGDFATWDAALQKQIACGTGAVGGAQAPLQFYPKFLKEGTFADGYGYYMQGRGPAAAAYGGKPKRTLKAGAGESKQPRFLQKAAEDKAALTGCRLLDSKKAECEADAKCEVYPYDGVDYCIEANSKAAAAKQSAAAKPAAGAAADKGGLAGGATAESYFAQEYAPGPDDFEVVDTVTVPAVAKTGEYVLSWRWDCEQTPQIWTTCADVRIHATQEGKDAFVKELEAAGTGLLATVIGGINLSGGEIAAIVISAVLFGAIVGLILGRLGKNQVGAE